MFFSFDGPDGAGKSTQVERFCAWVRGGGPDGTPREVVCCRDPGSTPLGETLRGVLLDRGGGKRIGLAAESLLYMAARAQLVEDVIRPALARGAVVVSDRYLLANVAYQGHAGGLGRDALLAVGAVATGGLLPDRVFLLDLTPEAAEARLQGRPADRIESRGPEYRARVRAGFLVEAGHDPQRIVVIDASASVEEVEQSIRVAAASTLGWVGATDRGRLR